jgi:hypothetical protein
MGIRKAQGNAAQRLSAALQDVRRWRGRPHGPSETFGSGLQSSFWGPPDLAATIEQADAYALPYAGRLTSGFGVAEAPSGLIAATPGHQVLALFAPSCVCTGR